MCMFSACMLMYVQVHVHMYACKDQSLMLGVCFTIFHLSFLRQGLWLNLEFHDPVRLTGQQALQGSWVLPFQC